MKKLYPLLLSLLIGTSSLFASTTLNDTYNDHKKPVLKEKQSNKSEIKKETEVAAPFFLGNLKAKKSSSKQVTLNEKVLEVLKLKNIEKREKLNKIRNYQQYMPEIISKE